MLIKKSRLPIRDIFIYGFLPNFLKVAVYRLRGYSIGKGVSIGFGSVVCGKNVRIGSHTKIGFLVVIRGVNITIGSHVQIGSATILDTPHVEIGDGSKINEQVFVGGLQFPDSKFVLGRNCQIMQMSFINPAVSIVIGDDTGIGGDCLLFGHTSWLSQFEGYPVEFKSIEIGNSVSIAWRVFILPGTKIGDGSVIGANSLVARTIPPRSLAVGFPARVVSSFPDFPQEVTEEQRVTILEGIIREMESYLKGSGLEWIQKEGYYEVGLQRKKPWEFKKTKWRLRVDYDTLSAQENLDSIEGIDVLLSLRTIPREHRTILNTKKISWIDIESKEQPFLLNDLGEEVVLFLRRYGVRFFRVKD
jgi:acetyltransferase-like isoleucine patch superfamily enzyme